MTKNRARSISLVFAFILVCGSLLFLIVVRVTAGASAPTVDTVTAAATSLGSESTFTLTENTTTTLYVHGTISDADGCEDVASNGTVAAKFYRSNHASGSACSADSNDCYTILNGACAKSGCEGPEDNSFAYECTAAIQYFADTTVTGTHTATDWSATVTATDSLGASASSTDTIEMNSTISIAASPSSLSYGEIALGSQSAEQTITVTNTGNVGIDINVHVDGAFACTTGVLSSDTAHYSTAQGFSYEAGTALSTQVTEIEFNFAPRTDDATPTTKNLYLLLQTPSTGAGGMCSNTLTVTSTADTENGW
ncbi:hypothetical protein HYV71_04675 [Candidatus Uhrbacteria bacterium]|nr:hypothetical protein [Candidatus Uhrbacteria bacterium]